MTVVDFALPSSLEAHQPPEARGLTRDGVRLLVGRRSSGAVTHHPFTDLPDLLAPGDVVVVNTSATLPAAVPVVGRDLTVHFSTSRPDGTWLIELRLARGKATVPYVGGVAGTSYDLVAGGRVTLVEPYSAGRLWVAAVHAPGGVLAYLRRHGSPIRYGYVPRPWPLSSYQTVFAREPGSAEMPSAGRPFTDRLVTRLVTAGVLVVPVLLHTGVASPEAHERPYPERFAVPAATARVVNAARAWGGRIIAVGTTVVRALESAASPSRQHRRTARCGRRRAPPSWSSTTAAGCGWSTGCSPVSMSPRASHLDMLAAIAGRSLLGHLLRRGHPGGLPLARVRRREPPAPVIRAASPRPPRPRVGSFPGSAAVP